MRTMIGIGLATILTGCVAIGAQGGGRYQVVPMATDDEAGAVRVDQETGRTWLLRLKDGAAHWEPIRLAGESAADEEAED